MNILKCKIAGNVLFATASLLVFQSSALADADNALRPYVDYIFIFDDNVLRIPDTSVAQATIGTDKLSDTENRLEGGLIFEKKISQQLLTAKVNVNRTIYNRFSELDYTGAAAVANWNWHVGNHIGGNVGADYERTLTPFTNFHLLQRNLRDVHHEYINAGWEFHPVWRINAGLTHYGLRYDLSSQLAGNRDENAGEIGLDYLAQSKSAIGLVLRHTRGTFPHPDPVGALLVDNSYDQNDVLGKIDWNFSEISHLQLLAGWSERRHDFYSARDYTGGSARLTARWMPTYKTGVTLSAWREVGATDNLATSYTLNQGGSLSPSWKMTEKTRLEGTLKYETQDYSQGSTGFSALPTLNRKDTVRYASLKITYEALQRLMLSTTFYHDALNSNIAQTGYGAYGIWLNARLTFF